MSSNHRDGKDYNEQPVMISSRERKMLLQASKTLKQADKDAIGMGDCEYGTLDKKLQRAWNVLIKKLRGKK